MHELGDKWVGTLLEFMRARVEGRAEDGLVNVSAAVAGRGDESDAKTAAPVAEKAGKAGGFVVLVRPELGVGDEIDGTRNRP
jgi:hypothetical protein